MALSAAGAAACASAASKSVFDYNREGFFEDREQRMKKEFAERKYRIVQAELWREDVRSFVELTEMKMSIYLVVNVLMLGFTLNLWCEGRLPEEVTPEWLMMGNQLAIAGAFCFLLLTVWLAMHAAVAAQSYQTRVLTQLVRLPIPSWDELEACRTYASEFEKLEPRQMFRVPFVTGYQEDVLKNSLASGSTGVAAGTQATSPAVGTEENRYAEQSAGLGTAEPGSTRSLGTSTGTGGNAGPRPMATDPWGLEKQGEDDIELGCQIGSDVAKLRHIKIMRQAAVYWQTYDAFARVSMSIGVNQLMLAISYYILGYALNEVGAPVPAFAGVLILICTAEMVVHIDLTVPVLQQRIIQFLLFLGPGISCLAAYHWSQKHDLAVRIAEGLAPVAFFSHGIVIFMLAVALRVREQENGAMLPLAFQSVLYLDVFGWVWHKHATPSHTGLTARAKASLASRLPGASDTWWPGRRSATPSSRSSRRVPEVSGNAAYYAADYFEAAPSSPKRNHFLPDDGESDAEPSSGEAFRARPALACIAYDDGGQPVPTRPEEMAKKGSVQDLRANAGAPRMGDTVNAVEPPAKEFWSPVTFMPPESRRRHKMDEFLGEHAEEIEHKSEEANTSGVPFFLGTDEDTPIRTGHDHEVPGVLPWQVFKLAAVISSFAWILGGVYFTLHVNHIWSLQLPWWWQIEDHPAKWDPSLEQAPGEGNLSKFISVLQTGGRVVQNPSVLGLLAAELPGSPLGQAAERVSVAWPYRTMLPRSLACDPAGRQLLVTDGLAAFVAEVSVAEASVGGGAAQEMDVPVRATFQQLPHCPAIMGKGIEDVALVCTNGGNTTDMAACESMMLYGRGRNLASCPLVPAHPSQAGLRGSNKGFAVGISDVWLQRANGRSPRSRRGEETAWILVDPTCARVGAGAEAAARTGCISVGTTHGRMARLHERAGGGADLVPGDLFELKGGGGTRDELAMTRAFNGQYLGVLQPLHRSIRILDAGNDGAQAGTLLLPTAEPIGSFCTGGDYVYLLGRGRAPSLWRFALPRGPLRAGAAPA